MSKRTSEVLVEDITTVDRKKLRPIRCEYCRHKNHVLVDCKCKLTLCLLHLPEDLHDCQFKFKEEHQKMLASNNPAIKAEKVASF